MLNKLLSLVFAVCMTASMSCANLADSKPWMDNAHKAMHNIVVADLDKPLNIGTCTANAVGPHALLTAEHCFLDDSNRNAPPVPIKNYVLIIDGEKHPTHVREMISDNADHVILILDHPDFPNVLPFVVSKPVQGEEVVFWGNPTGVLDQFRKGYVAGNSGLIPTPKHNLVAAWYLDLASFPGDSGSAFLDAEDGHIVGVDTYSSAPHFSAIFALQFTPAQMAAASK